MGEGQNRHSRHIAVWIDRPAGDVYAYASDVTHLPDWAAGLAMGQLTPVGDSWVVASPMGRIAVRFAPPNDFGVLDHMVALPGGEVVFNPMRVIPDGDHRCEVVFTLRRREGMSDAEFGDDAAAVSADLATLKRIVESQARRGGSIEPGHGSQDDPDDRRGSRGGQHGRCGACGGDTDRYEDE